MEIELRFEPEQLVTAGFVAALVNKDPNSFISHDWEGEPVGIAFAWFLSAIWVPLFFVIYAVGFIGRVIGGEGVKK
jgi:hypothetical protein